MEHAMRWRPFEKDLSQDALEGFLVRNRDYAYRLALRVTGCRELAEDVAQESLVRACRHFGSLTADVENERAWLRQIVVRRAITMMQKRERVADVREPSDSTDPSEALAVRLTLSKLNPDQRAILALSVGDGLSYEEIAAALKVPMGTVGSRIHAAKAAFRKHWEERP